MEETNRLLAMIHKELVVIRSELELTRKQQFATLPAETKAALKLESMEKAKAAINKRHEK